MRAVTEKEPPEIITIQISRASGSAGSRHADVTTCGSGDGTAASGHPYRKGRVGELRVSSVRVHARDSAALLALRTAEGLQALTPGLSDGFHRKSEDRSGLRTSKGNAKQRISSSCTVVPF